VGAQGLPGACLTADWRSGLPLATIAAIRAYVTQLQVQEQIAWQRLKQAAVDRTGATYTFPSAAAYAAVLQTIQPPEALLHLSRRLGVDVNRILLAYLAGDAAAPTRGLR
jgi:hypothetical protein